MRSVMERLRRAVRFLLIAGVSASHPAADERAEEWLDMLEENLSLPLRFGEEEASAAGRDGLVPEAGGTDSRRSLLFRLSPHFRYPDSVLHAMLLSEALVWSACPEERAAADEEAWSRYGRLSLFVPDSLVPPWEAVRSFLRASILRETPSCRAKLKIRAASGAFREDCRDPATVPQMDSGIAPGGAPIEAPLWSPACLQLKRLPAGACLVRSGEVCVVRVEEFNSASADIPIPASPLTDARADLLRGLLAQRFKSGAAGASGAFRENGSGSGKTDAPMPVRFRASSDSSRLASAGLPWLTAYRHELPYELSASLDSARPGGATWLRKTRFGYFQIDSADLGRHPKPGRAGDRIAALRKALDRRPALAERLARETYARSGASVYPDTLEFSLWLAAPSADTADCKPVRVRSVSTDNPIDFLAWKYLAKGQTDSLLGPFRVPYGAIRLKVHQKLKGAGKIPFPLAENSLLERAAQGLAVGAELGLWRQSPPQEPEPRALAWKRDSTFRDKGALALAVARLQSGADPGKARLGNLGRLPEPMLAEMYRSLRQERELGAWMDGLVLTPEAERMNLWF